MAQEFAKPFYHSGAWQACRDTYWRKAGGLCEDCLQQGIVTQGEEVHHLIPLTPENIHDPSITLSHDNLRLLCHACHMKRHATQNPRRYAVDQATGAVVVPPSLEIR